MPEAVIIDANHPDRARIQGLARRAPPDEMGAFVPDALERNPASTRSRSRTSTAASVFQGLQGFNLARIMRCSRRSFRRR